MYSAVLDHEFCRMADIAIINLASLNQSLALLERKVPALGGSLTKLILDEHIGGGVGGGGGRAALWCGRRGRGGWRGLRQAKVHLQKHC